MVAGERSQVTGPEEWETADFERAVAKRIHKARLAAGMSQSQLAAALNTTQSAISLYENGQRKVGLQLLLRTSKALNAPVAQLLGVAEGPQYLPGSGVAELLARVERCPEMAPQLCEFAAFLEERWFAALRRAS